MKVRCPHCRNQIAKSAPQGGLAVRGLAIVLVKDDGTVYGPCQRCRTDVELVTGGELSKALTKIEENTGRRRVVFVIEPDDG